MVEGRRDAPPEVTFLSCRYENEQPFKKAVEEEISSLYKVIDDANLTKTELEEQMDDMRAELRNLEHNHEQVPPKSSPFTSFSILPRAEVT